MTFTLPSCLEGHPGPRQRQWRGIGARAQVRRRRARGHALRREQRVPARPTRLSATGGGYRRVSHPYGIQDAEAACVELPDGAGHRAAQFSGR